MIEREREKTADYVIMRATQGEHTVRMSDEYVEALRVRMELHLGLRLHRIQT